MLTPQEFKTQNRFLNDINNFEKLCLEIDSKLKNTALAHNDYISIILTKEYSTEIREKVVAAYQNVVWSKVTHQTSSENGERPGLTSFEFYY